MVDDQPSASWAREICAWTDKLPAHLVADADRTVSLDTTLAGAGRLTGDLSPACAAALTAVLDFLGASTGPEDTRSPGQHRHDALEEACQRPIRS
jgi:hypothetical protein